MLNSRRRIQRSVMLFMVCTVLGTAGQASSQDDEEGKKKGFVLDSVTVGSGESTTTVGLTAIVSFTDENNRYIEFAAQQEQAWLIYGPRLPLWGEANLLVAASAGYTQGAPWAAPFLELRIPAGSLFGQKITVSTIHWPGAYAWEPSDWKNDGVENTQQVFFWYYGKNALSIGPVSVYYAWLEHLDDPFYSLPGMSFTKGFAERFSFTTSVTRNVVGERWMFYMGVTWKPARD